MKVAIMVPNFVEFDGSARVAEFQAKEFAKCGHNVSIFAFNSDIKLNDISINILKMPKNLVWQRIYRLFFPFDILKLFKWIPKLKNYDLVVVHLYPMTWMGYFAKKLYDVEYWFWFHGLEDPKIFPHFYERLYMQLQIIFTKYTINSADKVVSVSKFGHDKLLDFTGVDSEVIYNRIDMSRFHENINGNVIREKYSLEDSPVILMVGRLAPQKGVHLLIESFKIIQKYVPDSKLVLVGDPTFDYYFKQLKEMSNNSIIFAGHVSTEEIPFYYAMCDIYATTSLWENHNLSALEAQACGKPVIAFEIPAFKESINNNGTLVEIGNTDMFAKACIQKLESLGKI